MLEEREWDTNGEGAEDDKWEARRQYVYGGIYIDEVLIFDKDTDDDGDCVDGGGSEPPLLLSAGKLERSGCNRFQW